MFGILERWYNNQVAPILSKPHELSYRSNNKMIWLDRVNFISVGIIRQNFYFSQIFYDY